MPIKFNREFLSKFPEEDLTKIRKFRLASCVLASISEIITILLYIFLTFIGFIHAPEGHYFDYLFRENLIDLCYFFSFSLIFVASFSILMQVYSNKFIISPHLQILKLRKSEKKEIITEDIQKYKKQINYRTICQVLIIVGIIGHLNYYPRNTQLYYPFISCDITTGICVITNQVYIPFVIVMSTFLFGFSVLYTLIILVNINEAKAIHLVLHPEIIEKRKNALKEKAKIMNMPIEERKKLKLKQLQEDYEKKLELKNKKKEEKYEKKWEKEKLGKQGYKEVKKEIESNKEKAKKKEKADKYDFT